MYRVGRHDVLRLMRKQDERTAAREAIGAALDDSDAGVAILDRERELPGLKRRAHALVFRRRHLPAEHQRFGPAADGAVAGANDDVAGARDERGLVANLAAAGRGDPESSD